MRIAAFGTLTALKGTALRDGAIAVLRDGEEDDDVRAAAAAFLGDCGVSEAGPALNDILTKPTRKGFLGIGAGDRARLRVACVTAVGKLRYRPAKEVVEFLSRRDDDVNVRRAAREALEQL